MTHAGDEIAFGAADVLQQVVPRRHWNQRVGLAVNHEGRRTDARQQRRAVTVGHHRQQLARRALWMP